MITIYQHFSIDIFSATGTYNDSYTHYSARKFIEAHINLSDEQNGTNQMNSIIAVHWKRRKLFSNRQKTYQHSTNINYIYLNAWAQLWQPSARNRCYYYSTAQISVERVFIDFTKMIILQQCRSCIGYHNIYYAPDWMSSTSHDACERMKERTNRQPSHNIIKNAAKCVLAFEKCMDEQSLRLADNNHSKRD